MSEPSSDAYAIDSARSACLCDVGCTTYLAATTVDTDGQVNLVLAERNSIGDETVRYDANCPAVAHEQPGPLPPRWRDRVALVPLRCGRPTKSGAPCRAYVTRPGAACGRHRAEARR